MAWQFLKVHLAAPHGFQQVSACNNIVAEETHEIECPACKPRKN